MFLRLTQICIAELFTIDKKTGIISAIRAHELSGEVHLVIEVTDRKGNTSSSDHFDRTGVYIQIFPGNFRKPEFKFPNRVNSTLPAVEVKKIISYQPKGLHWTTIDNLFISLFIVLV